MQDLRQYGDFEGVMLQFVREQGWQFEYDGKPVEPDNVFHDRTFGPGLLHAAQTELQIRGIQVDLGLLIEEDDEAMFGKRVTFAAERNCLLAQMWRITQAAYQVESLPRNGAKIMLDMVPAVLRDNAEPALAVQG
ncbi:MAG: hypothetical protein ACREPE_08135 [Lysobacter sp.]